MSPTPSPRLATSVQGWIVGAACGRDAPHCPALDGGITLEETMEGVASGLEAAWPALAWGERWRIVEDDGGEWLATIERASSNRFLAVEAARQLELTVARRAPSAEPRQVGRTLLVDVDTTALPRLSIPSTVDRVVVDVTYAGRPIGTTTLPGGVAIEPWLLADVLADAFAWPLLREYATCFTGSPELAERGDEAGWLWFLRELWDRPTWDIANFYPREAVHPIGRPPSAHWEVGGSLDSGVARLAAADAVTFRVAGLPVGVTEPMGADWPTADGVIRAVTAVGGFELCRAVVREAVIGHPMDTSPLRDRLALRRTNREHAEPSFPPDARILPPARAPAPGRIASRRWAAPDVARPTGYVLRDPSVLAPVAIRSPHDAGTRGDGGTRDSGGEDTQSVPILTYHRIATGGNPSPYRIDADSFERQVAFLADTGHSAMTLDDWSDLLALGRPPIGRHVILTFDDGYADLLETVAPILQAYGMTGTVFVVTGLAGQTNRWDRDAAQADADVPLLGYAGLRELAERGWEIGAHAATHVPLTAVDSTTAARQLMVSRATLARELGREPSALSYPYGRVDGAVRHLVGASGFSTAVTTRAARSRIGDDALLLPRLEISGRTSFEDFVAMLAPASRHDDPIRV